MRNTRNEAAFRWMDYTRLKLVPDTLKNINLMLYICQGKQKDEIQKNEIKQNALIAVGGLIARLIVRL